MHPTKQVLVSQVFQARLAQAMGVTRVAQVTGLDRTGVEVACAVRPGGHVLQVCNGKGLTFEQACLGALFETAELWAAEHVVPGRLVWGARAELDAAQRGGLERRGAGLGGQAGGCPAVGRPVRMRLAAGHRAALRARGVGAGAGGALPALGRAGAGAGERGLDEQRLGGAPG